MKLVEQDRVTALLLTEPEREILRKALENVTVKLLARLGPLFGG